MRHLHVLALNETPRPHSMEYMAAGVSNEDALASKGNVVVLVSTTNGGSSLRYNQLAALGEDVVAELAYSDVAFTVIERNQIDCLVAQIDADLEGDAVFDVELRFYQFGKLIHQCGTSPA